jgi:hypothetical protein
MPQRCYRVRKAPSPLPSPLFSACHSAPMVLTDGANGVVGWCERFCKTNEIARQNQLNCAAK